MKYCLSTMAKEQRSSQRDRLFEAPNGVDYLGERDQRLRLTTVCVADIAAARKPKRQFFETSSEDSLARRTAGFVNNARDAGRRTPVVEIRMLKYSDCPYP